MSDQDRCPIYASFFGMMGASISITLCCLGAAYGTAKSSIGIAAVSVTRPDLIVRNLMPVILSGILGIYGLVTSVIISTDLREKSALHTNFLQLGAGISVGLSCLAAGFTIGIAGDAGVRGHALQPRLFVGMMLILIFAEVLGIYGLIVALLLLTGSRQDVVSCL